MLISREELRFDFGGAAFDLASARDRGFLGWVFNQFLYGEITGIQCGHWLYRAPSLSAATFLAKQAGEELAHVRKILRILSLLGERPGPAHWAIRFLASGMMGASWGEHVALEMALGESLVLGVFYAMHDTIPDPEIRRILAQAAGEEERHVEFGERETQAWLASHPCTRRLLLAQAVVQTVALRRLRRFVLGRLGRAFGAEHAVLRQFGAFYDHLLASFERQVQRLGLTDRPLRELSGARKLGLVTGIPFARLRLRASARPRLLTASYLADPVVSSESRHSPPVRSAL